MYIKRYCLALTTLLILFSPAAYAVQYTFSPRASITGEFSDNVFLSNANEQEDFITTLSAGFTAGIAGQRAGLDISYDPAYALYNEFIENDGWRHFATATGYAELTRRLLFDFRNVFLYTEDPLSEAQITELRRQDNLGLFDTTVRTGREPYWRNTASARLTYEFGQRDSVYADIIYGILENEDPTIEDSTYYTPSAGLTFWFTPDWGTELIGSYTKGEFDQTDTFIGVPSDDFKRLIGSISILRRINPNLQGYLKYTQTNFDFLGEQPLNNDYIIYDGSLGIAYDIVENITLNAEGGYWYRDIKDGDNNNGWRGFLELVKILRRGEVSLYTGAGYDQTFFGAQNLGFNEYFRIGFNGDYELFRRFTLDAFGAYRYEDYPDTLDRQDDIFRAGGGLTWQPLLWLSIRGGYSYRTVQSTRAINEYSENRATIMFSIEPAQPYRATP